MIAAPSFAQAVAALASYFQGEHNSLHPAGPFSSDIEWLYWVIFWIVFVAFVLTILAFARASAKTYSRAEQMLPIMKDEAAARKAQ